MARFRPGFPVDPDQVERWLSHPRFAPYLAVAGDHATALDLYLWNARVSAASMETLHHVEVLLRNAVDRAMRAGAPGIDPGWLLDEDLMTGRAVQDVRRAISRVERDNKAPTRGQIIASLSFGFWRALFNKRNADLWVERLHRAFPNGSGERSEIAGLMARLVPFRNRIAHHETLIRQDIEMHYEEMVELALIIDGDAAAWIEGSSQVKAVLAERPVPR